MGALHVLKVAADRPDLAAVLLQCPIVDGPATLRRLGFSVAVLLGLPMLDDGLRRLVGAAPRYVPIVGPPGSLDAVTVAERAPRGQARYYDADHFEVYHPPLLDTLLTD